jgi:hypothetical protein
MNSFRNNAVWYALACFALAFCVLAIAGLIAVLYAFKPDWITDIRGKASPLLGIAFRHAEILTLALALLSTIFSAIAACAALITVKISRNPFRIQK